MRSTGIIIKSALFVFLCISTTSSFAQQSINSPYSYFGLGELGGLDHGTYGAIGNTNITSLDSTTLNYYNPASYNTLSKGKPLFSFGISSRLSTVTDNDQSSFSEYGGLQHFALAFPIKKYFGFAFGFKPYSRRGYEIYNSEVVLEDTVDYEYLGTGGAHEAFFGLSTDLINFKNTRLAIGANLGYLFGGISNVRKSSLSTSLVGGVEQKILQINSFHYDLGAYFTQVLKSEGDLKHTISASFVFEPLQRINAKYSEALYYAGNVDVPSTYDTLSYLEDSSGSVSTVPTLSLGLNYTWDFKRTNGDHNSQLAVHAMYTTMDWSSYDNEFNSTEYSYQNSMKLGFGLQYIPETDFESTKANTKFYSRLRYRAGYYQYTLPYLTNGVQTTDFGTTFGVGLPVTIGKAISSINFGFAIGQRGTPDESALRENYYGINLGVTVSPSKADTWFKKRKLN